MKNVVYLYLKKIETWFTLIAVFILLIVSILSTFLNLPLLEDKNAKEFIFFTAFLVIFIHTIVEYYVVKVRSYKASFSVTENRIIAQSLFDKATKEIHTTQILGIPPKEDMAFNVLQKISNKIQSNHSVPFKFSRIIGIKDQDDLAFAKSSLEIKNLPGIDAEIYILDMRENHKFDIFTNVLLIDGNEGLIAFPSKKEGETRGIYFNDSDAIGGILEHYWLKLKSSGAFQPSTEYLNKLELILANSSNITEN